MRRMNAITAKNPQHTRQQLLDAAFEEILEHGFQAASLERILAKTNVTKGALYHHFPSKHALGLAVVDDVLRPMVEQLRIAPLREAEDPLEAIHAAARHEVEQLTEEDLGRGCPLNNLVQEMSPLDEQFRERLLGVLNDWHKAIAEALRRGQARGYVRKDVNADEVAWFVIIIYTGAVSFCRVMSPLGMERIHQHHKAVFSQTQLYMQSLRP